TGAARSMVAPLALLGIAGVNVFFMSFATDLYNTVSPDEGWGRARPWRPLLHAQLGYVYIVDPIFDYSHLLTHGLTLHSGAWALGYQGWHAPEQQHARGRASVGYGFWGASSGRAALDGSFAEVELALGG